MYALLRVSGFRIRSRLLQYVGGAMLFLVLFFSASIAGALGATGFGLPKQAKAERGYGYPQCCFILRLLLSASVSCACVQGSADKFHFAHT